MKRISVLTALAVMAAAGFYVSQAPPAAAVQLRIPVGSTDCGQLPANGFFVEGEVNGVPAYTDTLYIEGGATFGLYTPPRINGTHRIRARGFAGSEFTGGAALDPVTCAIIPGDEAWSLWSGPFEQPLGPAAPGQPVVVAVVE